MEKYKALKEEFADIIRQGHLSMGIEEFAALCDKYDVNYSEGKDAHTEAKLTELSKNDEPWNGDIFRTAGMSITC